MTSLRNQVNENYVKANRFIQKWQCFIYTLAVVFMLGLIIALQADYALSFSFFSKLEENELGILPAEKFLGVALKSILPVAVAVVLKFSFEKLPKIIQTIGFWALFALGLTIAIGVGRTQMTPVLIEAVEQVFPSKTELPEELVTIFGENELFDNVADKGEVDRTENQNSESQNLLSKDRFVEDFEAYALAYLMMTAFAVTMWMMLSNLYQKIKTIRQLKNTVIRPYKALLQKEREIARLIDKKDYLSLNREHFYRTAQDIVVKAFSGGLVVLKTYLNDLKIYGDHKRASRNFPFNQIYKVRWLRFVNVDVAEEVVEKADESIRNLKLISGKRIPSKSPDSHAKNLNVIPIDSDGQKEDLP